MEYLHGIFVDYWRIFVLTMPAVTVPYAPFNNYWRIFVLTMPAVTVTYAPFNNVFMTA